MSVDFKQKFYDITNLVQQEFDRNLELYGDKIQCRKGCSKCCSQIFRITPIDGWIITDHVKSMPEKEQNRLIENSKEYLNKSLLLSGGGLEGGKPCPALGPEGECKIYEARPVICRRFGMPIYDYKNAERVHACELNFSDGDEITDPFLIHNQTEIGKKWDAVKSEFSDDGYTTIAEAIVKAK